MGTNWQFDKTVSRVIKVPGYKDVIYCETQLVNDRGATLLRVGAGREFQELFQYTDGDISFEFWALRYDGTERRTIKDTYTVFLMKPYRYPSELVKKETIDKIREDLDEALRTYPARNWGNINFDIPNIKDVIFA